MLGGARSVIGYVILSIVTVSLPLFALGIWTNIRAGDPTADLGALVVVSLAGGLVPGLLIWLFLTAYFQLKQQRLAVVDTNNSTSARRATDFELKSDGRIRYHWRYDADYYSRLTKRYYSQLPRIRQPLMQYTLLWLAGVLLFTVAYRPSPVMLVVGALAVGAAVIPALTALTYLGIRFRYTMRPSFGTEADLFLSPAGITIFQTSLNGTFFWTTYSRAVRFDDGIMLLKTGAIRWLPDSALASGKLEDVMQLVGAHLTVRIIAERR